MAKEPRKSLRERVAERKRQELKDKHRDVPDASLSERERAGDMDGRDRARLWWKRLATLGTVLVWLALLAVIGEVFMLWLSDVADTTHWPLIIIYAVVFATGRVLKMVGDAQARLHRR